MEFARRNVSLWALVFVTAIVVANNYAIAGSRFKRQTDFEGLTQQTLKSLETFLSGMDPENPMYDMLKKIIDLLEPAAEGGASGLDQATLVQLEQLQEQNEALKALNSTDEVQEANKEVGNLLGVLLTGSTNANDQGGNGPSENVGVGPNNPLGSLGM